ncbi:Glycosyltransferase, GT2 family [Sphingomonas laterariae]|uniref:Glycosyltransferase, GT2 family n=1 Tax=Edaphosphingomonas laterariae TaxID=861865 RepID=A0A239HQI8_9SPHN|nr:glycosyltransferase family 2 protein [Sphingomonas laterariae]SNS83617.1 Glycosyltransferase, GT2 family [Sphingomonas laterariae]
MIAERSVGIVAIGRNEGERLKACLRSLPAGSPAVYVDSGSSDDSVAFARSMNVSVVELDMSVPFTAARARNAGLEALLKQQPDLAFVQMIDGDCTLDAGWIAAGLDALAAEQDLAVVFGRLRERFPERSLYNRLCDLEWDVPLGDALACGGIALFRADRLAAAGGYDPTLIAGEEPDLCARLRAHGWRIRRIAPEMARHDAAMTRLGQYWRRAQRSGHAFAELAWRGRGAPDPLWRRQVKSILVWAGLLPAMIAAAAVAALVVTPWAWLGALGLLLLYPLQIARLGQRERRNGLPTNLAFSRASLLVAGKFAELQGVLLYHWRRLAGRTSRLIEYKGATASR